MARKRFRSAAYDDAPYGARGMLQKDEEQGTEHQRGPERERGEPGCEERMRIGKRADSGHGDADDARHQGEHAETALVGKSVGLWIECGHSDY